jgi:hypothetical protein
LVDTEGTYEKAQQEFDDFLESQGSYYVPVFSDVIFEANGIDPSKVDEWYKLQQPQGTAEHFQWFRQILIRDMQLESLKSPNPPNMETLMKNALQQTTYHLEGVIPASIPHGYNDYVDTPESKPFPKKEIVIFKEQDAWGVKNLAYISLPEKVDDYTTVENKLKGYDYSCAYSPQQPYLDEDLGDLCPQFRAMNRIDVCEALDKYIQEREILNEQLAQTKNETSILFRER